MTSAQPGSAPAPPEIAPDPVPNHADCLPLADRADRHARILSELADMAMGLARRACNRAHATPSPENDRAFDRLARTVRHILALETWLNERTAARRAEQKKSRTEETISQRRELVHRLRVLVEPAIAANASPSRPLRPRFEAILAGPFLEDGLGTTPLPELVARICRTLGIEPDRANWPAEFLAPLPAEPEAAPRPRTASSEAPAWPHEAPGPAAAPAPSPDPP